MASAHRKFLQNTILSNEALIGTISQLAASAKADHEETHGAIKSLLLGIHKSICQFGHHRGHPRTPKKDILDAWRSFIDPIRELSKLPFGSFIAARTFLYFTQAFIDEGNIHKRFPAGGARSTHIFYEFCTELDDGLLQCLREIWSVSNKSEEFHWVFSEYCTKEWKEEEQDGTARERELAQVCSPDELITLGRTQGAQHYYAKPSDEPTWFLYTKPTPRWDLGDEYTEELLWKQVGTDGPIRGMWFYCFLTGRPNEEEWHCIDVLRRSRQFILDARQIAEPIAGLKKRQLLKEILYRRNIPPELQRMIMDELVERPAFTYLKDLDIAAGYEPFPKTEGPCKDCEKRRTRDGYKSLTCPQGSRNVWNLALRTFHVFHHDTKVSWKLCKHSFPCSGHHGWKSNWEIRSDTEFSDYIEAQARIRNPGVSSLKDGGFVPMDQISLPSLEEDEMRRKKFLSHQGPFADSANDLMMIGGVGGLKDCMLHGRTLLGAWQGRGEGDGGGRASTKPEWALGRHLGEGGSAQYAVKDLHVHGWHNGCEWC